MYPDALLFEISVDEDSIEISPEDEPPYLTYTNDQATYKVS